MPTTETSVASPLLPSPALRGRGGAKRRGEGESAMPGIKSYPRPRQHSHLVRDIYACMERDFMPIHPNDVLGPDVLAAVNRLLLRGGRVLAHAPGPLRAIPFAGDKALPLARTAYVALLKLLDCIGPGLVPNAPPGLPKTRPLPSGRPAAAQAQN